MNICRTYPICFLLMLHLSHHPPTYASLDQQFFYPWNLEIVLLVGTYDVTLGNQDQDLTYKHMITNLLA